MFKELVEKRRSIYSLGKKEVVNPEELLEIVKHSVKHAPTAFNCQSARVAVLFGKHHDRIWDIVLEALRPNLKDEQFAKTKRKIDSSFRSGYGTILFFEDDKTTEDLQTNFPAYKDNFPRWSEQGSGILQYIIWDSLAEKNVGASLQHYNPVIDDKVKAEWNIPAEWRLISQMPFGSIEAAAGDKDFLPIERRVKIFK